MNTNNLTIEQMREIVEGAPEWAKAYNMKMKQYTNGFIRCSSDVYLEDLRTAIATFDKEELEALSEQDDLFDQFEQEFFANQSIDDIAKHDCREFKVGDLVVSTLDGQEFWMNCICKIEGFHKKMAITSCGRHSIHHYEYRRASFEEIEAGHRIVDNLTRGEHESI